jgi:F0F1-type ATP synthase epsilon subunit
MSKAKINLKIITPEGGIEDSYHDSISLPGEFGVLELLPNHENYISLLKTGVISINKKTNFIPIFIISESFLRFDNSTNICEVNSEYAMNIMSAKKLEREFINRKIDSSSDANEKDFYNYLAQHFSNNDK